MGIIHFDTNCIKAMLMDKVNNFLCSVIRHQEVGMASVQNFKQVGVVNCAVGIKAGASPLSPFPVYGGSTKTAAFCPQPFNKGSRIRIESPS